jgi:ABC-type phosphate/phosphonate transport system substrate-binding protein
VIDAVLGGRADVGPVDAYGLDLLRRHGDERAQRVRVVASTVEAPSAPLVASPAVNAPTRARLTDALFAAHTAPELVATLDELLLARFVAAKPDAFDMMVERQRQAEVAGYPRLA